jgi:hypothetical protein
MVLAGFGTKRGDMLWGGVRLEQRVINVLRHPGRYLAQARRSAQTCHSSVHELLRQFWTPADAQHATGTRAAQGQRADIAVALSTQYGDHLTGNPLDQ